MGMAGGRANDGEKEIAAAVKGAEKLISDINALEDHDEDDVRAVNASSIKLFGKLAKAEQKGLTANGAMKIFNAKNKVERSLVEKASKLGVGIAFLQMEGSKSALGYTHLVDSKVPANIREAPVIYLPLRRDSDEVSAKSSALGEDLKTWERERVAWFKAKIAPGEEALLKSHPQEESVAKQVREHCIDRISDIYTSLVHAIGKLDEEEIRKEMDAALKGMIIPAKQYNEKLVNLSASQLTKEQLDIAILSGAEPFFNFASEFSKRVRANANKAAGSTNSMVMAGFHERGEANADGPAWYIPLERKDKE